MLMQLSLLSATRNYCNSEGTNFSFGFDQWELSAAHVSGYSLRRLTHQPEALPELTEQTNTLFQQSTEPAPQNVALPHGDIPVLLDPLIAGVLVHELIGHALEEQDLVAGQRLFPARTRVVAVPWLARDRDDDGTAVEHNTAKLRPERAI
ncbi:hypothetical protein [Gandjariella thermophila]|nr:hypothetical protein [Gandjariella thermophila]